MAKKLGILGGGRFGHLVADLADDTGEFSEILFFDDILPIDGKNVVGRFSDVETFFEKKKISHLAIAVGYKHFELRSSLYERFKGRIPFANCIHPRAFVSKKAELGEGVLVYSMCNIEMDAKLGSNVTIFNQSSVSHEVLVHNHSFLSVGISMGGGVEIGSKTFIGVNASIANDIKIGSNCIVCGGTFLTKSIDDDVCVIGNPFREISRVYL